MRNIVKILLLSFLIVSFADANGLIDDDMQSQPIKKSQKAKLPADYDKDSYINDDIKYDAEIQRVKEFKIFDADEEFGYVNIANLKEGQSGIVVNKESSTIIIANAFVVESDSSKSKLKFVKFDEFNQDAIPNTNKNVTDGDFFILNYLYEASTIVAPNSESFQVLRKKLTSFDFLHPDLLASFLKIQESPIPTKELLMRFAKEQNLGSIFFIFENKAYQVDSKTFKIIDIIDVSYENKTTLKPFYTRVEEIEVSTFDFGEEEIYDYTKYYKELLDIK